MIIDGNDGIDYNMDRHLRLRLDFFKNVTFSCHVEPDSSLMKDIKRRVQSKLVLGLAAIFFENITDFRFSLLAFSQVAVPFSSPSSCHDCSSAPGAGLPSSPCCHNSIHDSRTKSHR